jgi:hypothetical protein
MLTLPIKKKWFDMILSGEKKEEYREIKPYYITRFRKLFRYGYYFDEGKDSHEKRYSTDKKEIIFRNGYSESSPSFAAFCTLSIGAGRGEWGAEKGKEYFVLTIHNIIRI